MTDWGPVVEVFTTPTHGKVILHGKYKPAKQSSEYHAFFSIDDEKFRTDFEIYDEEWTAVLDSVIDVRPFVIGYFLGIARMNPRD